jgi:hypothetical protein
MKLTFGLMIGNAAPDFFVWTGRVLQAKGRQPAKS